MFVIQVAFTYFQYFFVVFPSTFFSNSHNLFPVGFTVFSRKFLNRIYLDEDMEESLDRDLDEDEEVNMEITNVSIRAASDSESVPC